MRRTTHLACAAALLAALLASGCTGQGEEPVTTTSPGLATIAPPAPTTPESTPQATVTVDVHDLVEGEADDVPDQDAFGPVAEAASGFVVGMLTLDWDHPAGPAQWVEAVAPYTEPTLLAQLGSDAEGSAGGWSEFMAGKQHQQVEVRTVAHETAFPFDEHTLVVTVEYATVITTPATAPSIADAPSQFLQLRMVVGESGAWLVSQVAPTG